MFGLPLYKRAMCVPGAQAGQRRVSVPLELEFSMVARTKLQSSVRAKCS